jgi:hypothetical protein
MYSKDGTANVFIQNVGEDARFFASFPRSGNQYAQLNQNKPYGILGFYWH